MRILIIGFSMLFLLWMPEVLTADVVLLKSGKSLEGKILSESAKELKIEVVFGKSRAVMTLQLKEIEKITRGELSTEEFTRRLNALKPDDLKGYKELLAWCHEKKMFDQEKMVLAKLPAVEIEARKKENPEKWCRLCDAVGKTPCKVCDGSGAISNPCSRCAGTGDGKKCVTCAGVEDSMLDCRRCGGAGTYERFDPVQGKKVKTRCRDCSGKGKIVCPICKGKKRSECKECSGNGKFPEKCEDCMGEKILTCKGCAGTGITVPKDAADPTQKQGDKKEKPKKKPVVDSDPFG